MMYDVRCSKALRYVDLVIPEDNWDQKPRDIKMYHADVCAWEAIGLATLALNH